MSDPFLHSDGDGDDHMYTRDGFMDEFTDDEMQESFDGYDEERDRLDSGEMDMPKHHDYSSPVTTEKSTSSNVNLRINSNLPNSNEYNESQSPRRSTPRYQFTEHMQDTTTPLQNVVPSFKLKNFPTVTFGERNITSEDLETAQLLLEAVELRKKVVKFKYPWESSYNNVPDHAEPETPKVVQTNPLQKQTTSTPATNETFYMNKGVMVCSDFKPIVTFEEHYKDFKKLRDLIWNAPTKAFCHTRLKLLEFKFSLYKALYAKNELAEQKSVKHRDFYNVRKVDNHIHLSSSMNQKHLLKFIKRKLRTCGHEKVLKVNGKELTLDEVFKSLNLTAYDLNVDSLEVHAGGKAVAHRFDKFNAKYNPFGQSELREIFLKTDNYIKGKYFSEICMQVFKDLEDSKYIMSEPRISIYGRKKEEWDNLAEWVVDNNMYCSNVKWMIQIPRLYHIHKKSGSVKTFQDMLDNIFQPLFEVTRDPSTHPKLHRFLKLVVAFDHVDDESKAEGRFHSRLPMPDEWCTKDNPPYNYYNYFFWANLNVLNQYRKSKGLNTIGYRPHAGEAGDISHLISAYLLADSIAHGIEVRHTPVLEYLFYLTQFGMSLSPLSNNHLFLKYSRNPFPRFFARGLNVTLSTDDPLMFHFTKEPLMEEYSIAAQVWHFSAADKCEIARSSVLQSGFPASDKQYWISPYFEDYGPRANQVEKTNVPNLRMQYRYETLMEEHLFIQKCLHILDRSENTFLKVRPILTLEETHCLIHELKSNSKFSHVNLNSNILRPVDAVRIVPLRAITSVASTSTEDLEVIADPHSNGNEKSVSILDAFTWGLNWKQTTQAFFVGSIPVLIAALGVGIGLALSRRNQS